MTSRQGPLILEKYWDSDMGGKRWTHHEIKCADGNKKLPLTLKEKELREKNPNKHVVHHVSSDNPVHYVRDIIRALS